MYIRIYMVIYIYICIRPCIFCGGEARSDAWTVAVAEARRG